MEDLRLRRDNREAEAATAQGQVAPLAARVKELEEELTRVADERDASNSWAEEVRATAIATAGQLGAEQRAHELTKGALAEATKAAEGESCSLCFVRFFMRSTPDFLSRRRTGEGGFQGSRGLSCRGPALEGKGQG